MFDSSKERRIARDADRIISLKEDMDATSWERVLEIGKYLLEGVGELDRLELARELVSIAQANRSLYTRLNLDPLAAPSHVMASGIEVMDGGLAQAALDEHEEQMETQTPKAAELARAEAEPAAQEPAVDASVVDEPTADGPNERDFDQAVQAMPCEAQAPEAGLQPDSEQLEPASEMEKLIRELEKLEQVEQELKELDPELEPKQPEAVAGSQQPTQPEASAATQEPKHAEPPPSKQQKNEPPQASEKPEPKKPTHESSRTSRKKPDKKRFANFRNLYESRDGGLCVFEDENGHIVAIDASKLA